MEEEDPLALIVVALREATEAARAAGAAAKATHEGMRQAATDAAAARAEARKFHDQLSEAVSGLEKRVAALARDIKAMAPPVRKPERDREARYVWAAAGFIGGIILCAAFFFLAAARSHAG